MEVTIRKSKNNEWGYVEYFSTYQTIDTGNIKVVASVTAEGKLSTPYVLRGEEFVPVEQIQEEMGIDKYIKAKKPFYSKLSDGFIVFIKAGVNYTEKAFLKDKTSFVIYKAAGKEMTSASEGTVQLTRILDIPDNLKDLMYELAEKVSKCNGDREEFLRSRF